MYDYLRPHADVFLPSPKELHVFDSMLRPDMFGEFHARAETEHAARSWRNKLADRVKLSPRARRHLHAGDRLKMIADPSHYADYFTEWAENYAVVGEITPSYASLSAKDFSFIRKLLEPHFDLRVLLLLRDPVERAYSASRHFRRVNRGRFDVVLQENNNDLFERLFDTPYVWERADYPRIFSNLEAVFSRSEIHVEFYERLFTEAAVDRLCDFLGIEPIPADFGKIVNASPKPNELDPDLAAAARATYAPIYEFCAQRFGDVEMEEIWPANAS